jgi:hypothetical protein
MPSQSSLGFNAGTRLFFPGFLKDFYGASSYTDVANVGSGPTTVQIRYYDGEGNRKGSDSHDLEANASYRFPIAEATASIGGIRVVSEDDEPLAASTTYRQIYGPRSGAHAALSVSGGGRIPSCPRQRASIPPGVRRGTVLDSRASGTDRGWV